jgi:DNA-binding beta-propeller fold protein YncE
MIHRTLGTGILLFAALALALDANAARAEESAIGPYKVAKTMHVGGEGGWDYLTFDPRTHQLYITRTTHTIVVDASDGKTVSDIPGGTRNHGTALVPEAGRGFITDGKDAGAGSVTIFDLKTNQVLGMLKAPVDADGIIYDPGSGKVLVVCGDAGVVFAVDPNVDPKNGKIETPVELGGKPEFLAEDGQGKAYINLADKDQVAVVDTKAMKVLAHWPTAPGGEPTGMSIDREHGRLFIGCRKPAKLVVMSTTDGKILGDFPIGPGVDATLFDHGLGLASCADGTLTVVGNAGAAKLKVVQTLTTAPGARTMTVDPATGTVYLATADLQPAPPPGPNGRPARPKPVPGTFKLIVVERVH